MRRGISAWLIEWQWAGEHARRPGRKFLILSPRLGEHTVSVLLGALYAAEAYTADEQALFARDLGQTPYPVRRDGPERLMCGHNPYLWARKVRGLRVESDHEGGEYLSYEERPVPRMVFTTGPDGVRSPERVEWSPGRAVKHMPVVVA